MPVLAAEVDVEPEPKRVPPLVFFVPPKSDPVLEELVVNRLPPPPEDGALKENEGADVFEGSAMMFACLPNEGTKSMQG